MVAARGDVVQYELVKRVPVDVFRADERPYIYSAADVNADNVRDDPLTEIARKADYTACPGMNVGHDADFATAKYVNCQQLLNLLHRVLLDVVSKNLRVVIVNRHHKFFIFNVIHGAKITTGCAETRQKTIYLSVIFKHLSTTSTKHE